MALYKSSNLTHTRTHPVLAYKKKKHMKTGVNNIITCVPPEILREVITSLDHYSLRALLLAYNKELKDYFLLITDTVRPTDSPYFFKGLNVKRTQMKAFDPVKHPQQTPLIKLFEYVDWFDAQTKWLIEHREPYHAIRAHPFMDKYSFVFLFREVAGPRVRNKIAFMNLSNVNLLFDTVGIETPECLVGPSGSDITNKKLNKRRGNASLYMSINDWVCYKSNYKDIRSLKVEYVSQVVDLHLEKLEQLTVFFGVGDLGHSNYPTIRNLIAPDLLEFSVFYHDHFPVMENIDVGTNNIQKVRRTAALRIAELSRFRLIQIEATKRHNKRPIPLPYSKCIHKTDLSFTKNYTSLIIVGGSDVIIKLLNLGRCIEFSWFQSNTQLEDEDPIIELVSPDLRNFAFDTVLNNVTIPRIRTRKVAQLATLSIFSYGLGLDLNGILRNASSSALTHLCILCLGFPSKEEYDDLDNTEHLPLLVDLRDIVRKFSSNISTLCVRGYCTVLCDNDNDTEWLEEELTRRGIYSYIRFYHDDKGMTPLAISVPDSVKRLRRPAVFKGGNSI